MEKTFDPHKGLIVVRTLVDGPRASTAVSLALDTGAIATMLSSAVLQSLGCDPGASEDRVRVTTASGVEYVPRVLVRRIAALGQQKSDFPVLSHTLPPSASVDGVIGLDFLRGTCLTVDFRGGRLRLE